MLGTTDARSFRHRLVSTVMKDRKEEPTMMNWNGGNGSMGWAGGLLMILVTVAVVALILWAVRAQFPGRPGTERTGPLDLLKRRYAAGELTHAEYEQARHAIE